MKAWITGLQLWPLPPVWKCSDLSPLKWLICGSGDATNEIHTIPSSCCQCHHLLPPEVDNPSRWNEPTCACYMGAGTSGTMHGEAAIPFYNSWKGCRWTNLLDVVWRSVNSHVRFYSRGLCLAGSWRHVARTPPLANDKRLCVCVAPFLAPLTPSSAVLQSRAALLQFCFARMYFQSTSGFSAWKVRPAAKYSHWARLFLPEYRSRASWKNPCCHDMSTVQSHTFISNKWLKINVHVLFALVKLYLFNFIPFSFSEFKFENFHSEKLMQAQLLPVDKVTTFTVFHFKNKRFFSIMKINK